MNANDWVSDDVPQVEKGMQNTSVMCPNVKFINGPEKTTTCDNFDWRGPQEAGK